MRRRTFFDLLIYKTEASLRTEVSRYHLKYLWWIIEPVMMMAVFYVVFGMFLARGTQHFVAFLLTGLTFWNWFAKTVNNASACIIQGKGLMLQVSIPKVFFPLEVILRDCFKLLFSLTLLLIFLFFYPTPVTITWLALPVLLFVQLFLNAGVAILCSAIVPFVPDLKFVITNILQLMFFASGIFYSMESIASPRYRSILYLNPMCGMIKAYRDTLIHGAWPDWYYIAKVFIFAILLLGGAIWLVKRFDHIYPRICQQ